MTMKAQAQFRFDNGDYDLAAKIQYIGQNTILVLSKIEWTTQNLAQRIEPVKTFIDGQEYLAGSISMRDFMQTIMDVGWENGLRPIGYQDVKNETTAIREHLADMRHLTFTLLEIPPVIKK